MTRSPTSNPARATRWYATPHDGSRMLQLDILRGVAILLVLFTHAVVQPAEAGSWRPVLAYLRYLGPTGVDLFFVLSGFLVGGLLLREIRDRGRLDVRRFLIRRGFKIWPPYAVFLAFVFLWLVFAEGRSALDGLRQLAPNLLHVQNYFWSQREHTWSLAVEEHFYIALPLLLLALTAWRARAKPGAAGIPLLPVVAIAVVIACTVARYFAYAKVRPYNPHFATHLRLDSLLFGVLLAYYHHYQPLRLAFVRHWRRRLMALVVLVLLAYPAFVIIDQGNRWIGSLGFTMLYLAYGGLLLLLVQSPLDAGMAGRALAGPVGRALAYVGYFSYPIYLWHLDVTKPTYRLLETAFMGALPLEARWLIAFIVYVLLAVAVGALLGMLVDRPAMALRERLFPMARRPLPEPRAVVAPDFVGAVAPRTTPVLQSAPAATPEVTAAPVTAGAPAELSRRP